MKKSIFSFLKKKQEPEEHINGKEIKTMNTEFVNSITFEEDPFADEVPAYTKMYDLEGNEVAE